MYFKTARLLTRTIGSEEFIDRGRALAWICCFRQLYYIRRQRRQHTASELQVSHAKAQGRKAGTPA